ncbi:YraN family protein [Candidatus Parcubacteria bacterium]|nr:MAG: YraN family protein [Candidatus Parcubacteria bacterium]
MKTGRQTAKQKRGQKGESIAEIFLKRKGYRVIQKNYRKPWGEIDIIAEKGNIVRFVEVKTVSRENYELSHNPEDLVDRRKLIKVARTAALYMEHTRDGREFQIDVVGVIMDDVSRIATCRLFEQALESNL